MKTEQEICEKSYEIIQNYMSPEVSDAAVLYPNQYRKASQTSCIR